MSLLLIGFFKELAGNGITYPKNSNVGLVFGYGLLLLLQLIPEISGQSINKNVSLNAIFFKTWGPIKG